MKTIAVFAINNILFGVETKHIHDFLPPKNMVKIPQKESQVFNQVLTLEDGRFVHVANTEKLLGLQNGPFTGDTKLMIVQSPHFTMGLLADAVVKLLDVEEDAVQPHMPISSINKEFLSGIITDGENVVVLLNIDNILATVS